MSSPPRHAIPISSSPSRMTRADVDGVTQGGGRLRSGTVTNTVGLPGEERDVHANHARMSPTLMRSYDPNDPDVQERQRTMDVDSAMQLSRARSGSVAIPGHSTYSGHHISSSPSISPIQQTLEENDLHDNEQHDFPFLAPHGEVVHDDAFANPSPSVPSIQRLAGSHDQGLLASLEIGPRNDSMSALPLYQANVPGSYRSNFDFSLMEHFAAEEKEQLGITSPKLLRDPLAPGPSGIQFVAPNSPRRVEQRSPVALLKGDDVFVPADTVGASSSVPNDGASIVNTTIEAGSSKVRQRKLSQSNSRPRRKGGKMALFEGSSGAPPPSFGRPGAGLNLNFASGSTSAIPTSPGRFTSIPAFEANHMPFRRDSGPSRLPPPLYAPMGDERPYRFSFYSNALSATIHARSLSELPAEGQTFEDLFLGLNPGKDEGLPESQKAGSSAAPADLLSGSRDTKGVNGFGGEPCTWWLDVTSPTDEEMKLLSKVFSIHPLTTEDIQMEESREKIELFRNYYLVCFRSFDQDVYSPTYLEPLNMYIVVFREGTLSFHFRPTPHPQNVRRRIKQLRDYINVTSDWISYALIDDITDAFGPLIQSIEYEVDSIDELVLILKEAEQTDMLRRIGTCRKKVMGLLRLMGNKADVVKGLAKRCNENWSVAPKSDIGLYLSDIQDHLITMTQNLNHYEKILSRSHSNYLAQISIEMTDANNQINDVLSKLTALGTVLIPMNLVTGLWGMNVHVPGEDDRSTYKWFASIIAGLVGFACLGGFLTYRLLIGRR